MGAEVWANLIAAVAIVVAVLTLIWSRVDVTAARHAAAKADDRADRAVAAQEAAVEAQNSITDAIRGLSIRQDGVEDAIANFLPYRDPDWQLVPVDDTTYRLTNVGGTAYDVAVDCQGFAAVEPPSPRLQWRTDESATFTGIGRYSLPTGVVRVSYRRTPIADLQEWVTDVPR